MLRILDDAEQAAARIDWSGGGDGAGPAPNATDTRAFTGVGAPGLAFASLGAVVAAVQAAAAEQAQSRGGGGARASRASLQGSLDGQTETPTPEDVPDSAAGRSEEYRRWSEQLRRLPAPYNDIRFFDAAAHVTSLLGMVDQYFVQLGLLQAVLADIGNLPPIDFLNAALFLKQVGAVLYNLNADIYNRLISGDLIASNGRLISPLAGTLDNFPLGYTVASALEFDIHMVFLEQQALSRIIRQAGGLLTPSVLLAINILLDFKGIVDRGVIPVPLAGFTLHGPAYFDANDIVEAVVDIMNVDDTFVDWARDHLGTVVDFSNQDDRVAMGIARVFQEHGLSHEEYLACMETIEARSYTAPPSVGAPTGGAQEE